MGELAKTESNDLLMSGFLNLLLDHHVRRGSSPRAWLDHAGGPGVEDLLALDPHHALARTELGVAWRILGTTRSTAFTRTPVHNSSSSKLLAWTLRGALWWVAWRLVTLSWSVSCVVAHVAVVARRLLLQFQLRRVVLRVVPTWAQLLRMVLVELKKSFQLKREIWSWNY